MTARHCEHCPQTWLPVNTANCEHCPQTWLPVNTAHCEHCPQTSLPVNTAHCEHCPQTWLPVNTAHCEHCPQIWLPVNTAHCEQCPQIWLPVNTAHYEHCPQTQTVFTCNKAENYFSSQTSVVLWMLYSFFWLIPRHLNFICRRFGTVCSIFMGRVNKLQDLWRWKRQSVPKRQHIKFRRRGIIPQKI